MGAHEHGLAPRGELHDQPEDGTRRLGVEACRRLVEEQQVGLVQHRAGEGQAGPHPRRVRADAGPEGVLDAESLRRVRAPLVDPVARDLEELGAVAEIVVAGQPVVQGRAGGDDAAATPHRGSVRSGRVHAVHPHAAPVRGQGARHEAHDRGLPGAVGSEEHRDRTRRDREAEGIDRHDIAEGPPDALQLDHRGGVAHRPDRSARQPP